MEDFDSIKNIERKLADGVNSLDTTDLKESLITAVNFLKKKFPKELEGEPIILQKKVAKHVQILLNTPTPTAFHIEALKAILGKNFNVYSEKIPIHSKFNKENMPELYPNEEKTCNICMMEIDPNKDIKTTPCNHHFHSKCLEKWIHEFDAKTREPTCPSCRTSIVSMRSSLTPPTAHLRLIEEAKVLGERANEDRRGGRLTLARRHYKIALLKINRAMEIARGYNLTADMRVLRALLEEFIIKKRALLSQSLYPADPSSHRVSLPCPTRVRIFSRTNTEREHSSATILDGPKSPFFFFVEEQLPIVRRGRLARGAIATNSSIMCFLSRRWERLGSYERRKYIRLSQRSISRHNEEKKQTPPGGMPIRLTEFDEHKLTLGAEVDAKDRTGRWYPAVIIRHGYVTTEYKNQYRVHFTGWSSENDEWIEIGTNRLARPGSHTQGEVDGEIDRRYALNRGIAWHEQRLVHGQQVDVKDRLGSWYPATIRERKDNDYKVHFNGWSESNDEYVSIGSNRLAVSGRMTSSIRHQSIITWTQRNSTNVQYDCYRHCYHCKRAFKPNEKILINIGIPRERGGRISNTAFALLIHKRCLFNPQLRELRTLFTERSSKSAIQQITQSSDLLHSFLHPDHNKTSLTRAICSMFIPIMNKVKTCGNKPQHLA